MAKAVTVLGETSPESLGVVLPHEHLLWDQAELQIAGAVAPYLVDAGHIGWWDGDPHLGEPTTLFQVLPVREGDEYYDPTVRLIVVQFALLWDRDGG